MKHAALLTLTLALGTASAASLPTTKEFTTPVSLTTPIGGMTLETALSSISRAAGITLVARDLPAIQVKANFVKRPFREVFQTLVNVYGADNVDYASLGNKLVVVAPTPILARTVTAVTGQPFGINTTAASPAAASAAPQAPITEAAMPAEPMTVQVYAVRSEPNALISVVAPFYPQAKVVAFGRTLLVNATESDHLTIKKLIDSLDATTIKPEAPAAPTPVSTVRKTYPLLGSAADITTLIKTYYPDLRLSVAETAKLIVADVPDSSVKDFESLLASVNVAATPAASTDELPFASFPMVTPSQAIIDTMRLLVPGADIRYIPETGMVVVRGTPEQIVRATTALNMINVTPSSQFQAAANPNAVTQRVYRISYAKASDLLARIKSFSGPVAAKPTVNTPLTAAATATASAMGSASGSTGDVPVSATPALIVEADERTNAIVAMGTTKQLDDLQKTIDLLDIPVSQVRLRIRIEQVQSGNGNDLGLAWKAGIGGVNVGADASGLSVGYAPLGALNPINLEVKLNALASKGASKTLMNTQFLTQDNQVTKFNAGGSILLPVSTPAASGTTGTSTTTSDYKSYDYGLGVEMQPRIGADGNIELALKTDIGQKPADGPRNSVLFEKQTLNTKISIKQNETIVLGGLLTTEERNTSAGVPLLSQIPVIGALFRKTTSSTSTSDLLFVLSAEVINPAPQRVTGSTDVPRDPNSGAQTTNIGGSK